MPKYFFNTVDGRRFPDEDGTELPDLAAARVKATRLMGELLKEQPEDLWRTGRLRIEVADEAGSNLILLEVSLSDQIAA